MEGSMVSASWQSATLIVENFRASIWHYTAFQQLFNTRLNWTVAINRLVEQDLFGLQSNQVTDLSINIFLPNAIPGNTVSEIPSFAKMWGFAYSSSCFADHRTGAVLVDMNHWSQHVGQGLWDQDIKTTESRQCRELAFMLMNMVNMMSCMFCRFHHLFQLQAAVNIKVGVFLTLACSSVDNIA